MLKIEKINDMIQLEIYQNAEYLIDYLQDNELINIEDWSNLYEDNEDDEDDEITHKEVFEYYIVSEWLYNQLKNRDEVTLYFNGLHIWGRCATGWPVEDHKVMSDIFNNLQENSLFN